MENYVRCKFVAKNNNAMRVEREATTKYTPNGMTDIVCNEVNESAPNSNKHHL